MNKSIAMRAAAGALLIGTGLALMLSATRKITCEECAEETTAVVATVEEPVVEGD